MRVIHVAPTAFGKDGLFGGGERYPLELARALAQHVPCELVTFGPDPGTRREGPLIGAVDDAGAGYASLRHIIELRPRYVKLDGGLVNAINADPIRQALVAGMLHFASSIGVEIIAEGWRPRLGG